MARRISIINFKGGVGKTTLAFEFASGLARFAPHPKVLLIDVDHQSSLSIVCMGGAEWEKAVDNEFTSTEVFKYFVSKRQELPGREIVYDNPIRHIGYENLGIVPASLELDDIEIQLTGAHHGNAIESEWDKRTLICRWLEDALIDEYFDYIIFDCPPATKIVSQNAIAASHGYVVPVVPEAVMERGVPHLTNIVETRIDGYLRQLSVLGKARATYVPNTQRVGLVITRIRTHGPAESGYTDDHTRFLRSLQREWGSELIAPYVEDGTGISQTLAEGIPVYDRKDHQNIRNRRFHTVYRQLTDELKSRIDTL